MVLPSVAHPKTITTRSFVGIIALCLLGWSVPQVAQAQICLTYQIAHPAGLKPSAHLVANNNDGTLLGEYLNGEPTHGFRLIPKRLPGVYAIRPNFPVKGFAETFPRGISNLGDIVGFGRLPPSPGNVGDLMSFIRKATGGHTLLHVPGSLWTVAQGLNRRKDVVGGYFSPDGGAHGFLRAGGIQNYITVDVPGAEGHTQLAGINTHREMVGWYDDPVTGVPRGVHIVGGVLVDTELVGEIYATLDVPGASGTYALAINDTGDIVGTYLLEDPVTGEISSHGFLYQDGVFYTITPGLGETDSEAVGINSATSTIVGNFSTAEGQKGFIATPTPCAGPAVALLPVE